MLLSKFSKSSHVWLQYFNSICSKTKIIEIVEAKRDLIKHSIHWKITHRCCTGVFTLFYFVSIKTNSKTKRIFMWNRVKWTFQRNRHKNVHFIVICSTEWARQDKKKVVKPVCNGTETFSDWWEMDDINDTKSINPLRWSLNLQFARMEGSCTRSRLFCVARLRLAYW